MAQHDPVVVIPFVVSPVVVIPGVVIPGGPPVRPDAERAERRAPAMSSCGTPRLLRLIVMSLPGRWSSLI